MIHCNPVDPDESNGNIVGTITMQPNHSLSWKALGYFLMFMLSVSFTIAFAFTAMGYWVVLPFTALEMAVLSYCLWLCLKRSSIQEVLSLTPETIKLEVGVKRPQQTYQWQRFKVSWTQCLTSDMLEMIHGDPILSSVFFWLST